MKIASFIKSLLLVCMVFVCLFAIGIVDSWSQDQPGGEPGTVFVKKIIFKGNTVIDTETLQKAVERFTNTGLSLEDMSELADLVTITYQEKGYILARAYLPEQEIEDGVLNIAIAEGLIGKLRVTGKIHYHDRVVKRYFKRQEKHGVVNEALLEKGLLLSKELPDIETEVVLKGGEKAGEVDIVLDAKDSSKATFTAHLSLDYNNYGSELVSMDRYGMALDIIDHNWGSKLNIRGVIGNNAEDTALGIFDFTVPVNSYGTKFGVSYLDGDYAIGQELADLGLEGRTTIFGVKAEHPIFKRKNKELKFTFGYDHKYSRNYLAGDVRSTDVLDVFYGTLDYESLDRFLGKNIFSLGIYSGRLDLNEKYVYSRLEADTNFSRYKLSLTRIQRIFGYTNLMVRGTGQYSENRLVPVEMIVIGGYGTARGHDPSQFLGDSGYYVSSELMFAPPFIAEKNLFGQRIAQLAQFSLFYDHGGTFINDPDPSEIATEFLSGYGAGLRLFYKDKFTFKYDIGFPIDQRDDEDDLYHYFLVTINMF